MTMTKSQTKTLETLTAKLASGPVNVTFAGIKGVNANSLEALVSAGIVTREVRPVDGRSYPDMFVTAINL